MLGISIFQRLSETFTGFPWNWQLFALASMTSSSSTHDSPTLPNMELPALILISVNISWRNCLSLSCTSLENRYIIVDSLRYVHWFGGCTVFRVQRSLSVLDFDLKSGDFTQMEAYDQIEGFLPCVFTDLFDLSFKIIVRFYFGLHPIL